MSAAAPSRLRWWLIAAIALAVGVFAWRQNHAQVVGGPISVAKTWWLGCTLTVFFALPFALWKNARLAPAVRALFGWVFASFAARGAIELAVIYATRGWKCGYGISHDLFTLALAEVLARRVQNPGPTDRRALHCKWLLQAVLLIEAYMAWRFRQIASPAHGIYFAADTPEFRAINELTLIAVAAILGAVAWFLWITRNDF